jgi:hypothetical protein
LGTVASHPESRGHCTEAGHTPLGAAQPGRENSDRTVGLVSEGRNHHPLVLAGTGRENHDRCAAEVSGEQHSGRLVAGDIRVVEHGDQ